MPKRLILFDCFPCEHQANLFICPPEHKLVKSIYMKFTWWLFRLHNVNNSAISRNAIILFKTQRNGGYTSAFIFDDTQQTKLNCKCESNK